MLPWRHLLQLLMIKFGELVTVFSELFTNFGDYSAYYLNPNTLSNNPQLLICFGQCTLPQKKDLLINSHVQFVEKNQYNVLCQKSF